MAQDDTPIMCKSFKPVSFVLNRPLRRPEPVSSPDREVQPEPISLPPVRHIPPPPHKLRGKYKTFEVWDASILRIDGISYMEIDGDLVEVEYERHSGPINKYPRPHPVPGLNKKPRGRKVPTKESKERKGTTYPCIVCHRAFTRPDHMKRHMRSVHMHMENSERARLRLAGDMLTTSQSLHLLLTFLHEVICEARQSLAT